MANLLVMDQKRLQSLATVDGHAIFWPKTDSI